LSDLFSYLYKTSSATNVDTATNSKFYQHFIPTREKQVIGWRLPGTCHHLTLLHLMSAFHKSFYG